MQFKAAIFDLDGTLINSLEDLADSMNTILKTLRYPEHKTEEYRYYVGNGIRNLVKAALPEEVLTDNIVDDCYKMMMELYTVNCINKTKPYDGIACLLDELKGMNIKLAVLSNKAAELTGKIVNILFPGCFDIVMGLTPEIKRKPDPEGALKISRLFEVNPPNIIYAGDTNVDMETAVNAGMYGVGVLWGFRTKDELISSGAKEIIKHPGELVNIF